jgi:predicted ester cyclase
MVTLSSDSIKNDAHRAHFEKYLGYCNAHDWEGMQSNYAAPISVNDEPWAPTQVTEQFKSLVTAFPDWRWEVRHVTTDGEIFSFHFRAMGTHRGTFQGIEPTGRQISTTQYTLYRLVDDKFTEVWDLVDWEGVLKQLQN